MPSKMEASEWEKRARDSASVLPIGKWVRVSEAEKLFGICSHEETRNRLAFLEMHGVVEKRDRTTTPSTYVPVWRRKE